MRPKPALIVSWAAPLVPPLVGEGEVDDVLEAGAGATLGVPDIGPAVARAPTPPVTGPLSGTCYDSCVSIVVSGLHAY